MRLDKGDTNVWDAFSSVGGALFGGIANITGSITGMVGNVAGQAISTTGQVIINGAQSSSGVGGSSVYIPPMNVPKTDWTPFIIAGGALVGVGVLAYFLTRKP